MYVFGITTARLWILSVVDVGLTCASAKVIKTVFERFNIKQSFISAVPNLFGHKIYFYVFQYLRIYYELKKNRIFIAFVVLL